MYMLANVVSCPGGYSGFQLLGMIEWGQKSTPLAPKKSLGLPTKPPKNPWTKA